MSVVVFKLISYKVSSKCVKYVHNEHLKGNPTYHTKVCL